MASTFMPGTAAVPATKVEISVSCRNLRDRDVMSKSDPMCVLSTTSFGSKEFTEFERTEQIKNTLNPDFVHKFNMTYFFEESQPLQFEVYDVDSPKQKLGSQDFVGRFKTTLGEILGSPSNKMEKLLIGAGSSGAKDGTIIISAEEVSDCKDLATLSFKGHKLDNKDFMGKSDPFLVFHRCNEDNSFTTCHKTEVIKNTLNPTWRPFPVMVRALCNGDYDRTIKVECHDYDDDGSHDLIGEFKTNMRQLAEGKGTFELINPKKKAKKKGYHNSGTLELTQCTLEKQHSFLDYITGGMQINFTVAIDFTGSNGNPAHPSSLHYINPAQPNHYEQAIMAVGGVVQDYDTDKLFPTLGFGAKLPDGTVSHEFAVNFQPQNPFCAGIAGVMQAYQNCIRQVQLYGPTNFAPIINHVSKFAQEARDGSNYFILLIITDGVISDMEMTKSAIIKASSLPMSVIIIGVGPADFDAMEELDADKGPLTCMGHAAQRDIVQFVPFKQCGSGGGGAVHLSQARLAKEVLAEAPQQIVAYMKRNGITPKETP